VVEGDRLMLDLSAAAEDECDGIVGELPGFRGTVRARRAALVIVLPIRAGHRLRHQLDAPYAELGRPDGAEVFEAHLNFLGMRSDGSMPTELAGVLDRASMEDIASLARLVQEERNRSDSPLFVDFLNQALAAQTDRAREVAQQVKKHTDGRVRAMLLVSAMFEGRAPGDVFTAQQLLLQALDFNNGLMRELEQPDLPAQFEEIGVEVDSNSSIRFTKLNYADAVRKHFWSNFPGLRDCFRQWVLECGRRIPHSADQGTHFVGHYARECLRALRSDDLAEAIQRWTIEKPVQMELALSALDFGLADPRLGWKFRRKCYDWSTSRNLPSPLAHVVIAACFDSIAPNYPNQAIVRLHHLTRNRDDGVAEAARVKLITLIEDRRLLRRLLARLTDPTYSRLADSCERRLFLATVDAHRLTESADFRRPLIVEAEIRRQLVNGWRAVLGEGRQPEYVDYVRQWLDTYLASRQDDLLTVLVEACAAKFAHLATLHKIGLDWLCGREQTADNPAARRTIQRLYGSINAVLKPPGA